MENITNMISLRGGGRASDTTQGGRIDGNMGVTMGQRWNSGGSISNDWDDASAPYRDDPSAPNVGACFGGTGEQTTGDLAATVNVFALGGGGRRQTDDTPHEIAVLAPPREITQWSTPDRGA